MDSITGTRQAYIQDGAVGKGDAQRRHLSKEHTERLFRIQYQGALVRLVGMLVIWFFTLIAYLYNSIDMQSLKGASLAIGFVILMHLPTIPVLRYVSLRWVYESVSMLINVMEIIGYTCFIYFVGGFRTTYLTPIYTAMIFYVGVLTPRRYPFILAGLASFSFSLMVFLEHYGFIPHQNVVFQYNFETNIVFLIVLIICVMQFVVAFMASYTAGVIHRARIRLKAQNIELETANERLMQEIEERNRSDMALRESEKKLHDIFDNVSDALFSHDLEGRFLESNLGMKRLLGYHDHDVLPENFNLRDIVAERYKAAVDVYLQDVLIKGKGEGVMRVQVRNGERLVEFKNSLIRDASGEIAGIRGSARDITEKYKNEKEKQKLQEQLQQAKKMEALGTLAGGVAHDLNNILSGIVSYPELLLMEVPPESPLRKPLVTIQKSGEKAASIVQDLLTLARRGVAVSEAIDLNAIIREYLKSPEYHKLQSLHPKIELITEFQGDLEYITGSPVHVSKTIMNLVTNAAESMPDGGRIMISTKNTVLDKPLEGFDEFRNGRYVVLSVSDTGVGMSDKDRERIFDPFYTKKVMGRSGTGLGLTVVWGTVKDMEGHVEVQSSQGKGSTFTLYFPASQVQLEREEEREDISDYSGKGEKILVVDDSIEQREIATGMLVKLGYTVVSVPSGESAVKYLESNSADLVLLDMIMHPGMDGLDTYRKILEIHPGQKAIIASGYSETDRVRQAQKIGAGSYIRKPYLMEKIGISIRQELEKP